MPTFAAIKAATHAQITTATIPRSITGVVEGTIIEDLCDASEAQDLQAVTDAGNTTTNSMVSGSIASLGALMEDQNLALYRNNKNLIGLNIQITGPNGRGFLNIEDEASELVSSIAGNPGLTDNRIAILPDEGDGTGLDATIVLHTTKDDINVTDGSGNNGTLVSKTTVIQNKQVGADDWQVQITGDKTNLHYENGGDSADVGLYIDTAGVSGNLVTPVKFRNLNSPQVAAYLSDINPTYGVPTITSIGAGAGTGGTVTIDAGSNDKRGWITVTAGTGASTSLLIFQLNFSATTPGVAIVTSHNDLIAPIPFYTTSIGTITTGTGFIVYPSGVALTSGQIYKFTYAIIN